MDFLKPYGVVPSKRQMAHYRMEKKAFFHFGVNTFTSKEWGDGLERESEFNPVGCDCRQWIKSIKAAGFTLAIITAKHHDGFCLWPSAYTEHSVKNSPYKDGKGDIIREFTDACHEFGVKVGMYLSPWDRNAPFWGTEGYSEFYQKQLIELLSDYGKIDEVWWDGAGSGETPYDWGLWAYTIRNLQPDACIFGSLGATPYTELRWCGNECGFAGDPCFSTIDAEAIRVEKTDVLNSGSPDGDIFRIAEVDVSIRPGWFYHEEQDDEVKSAGALVHLWFDSVGSNANMLLNFPPDKTGHLNEKDVTNAVVAHNAIEKARSVNLAAMAEVSCDCDCYDGYEAENILNTYDESYFAPCKNEAVVTLKFKEKISFNMFEISEVIELGHRVRGFRIEAVCENSCKILFDGKCIGYKWSDFFDDTETDEVRIVIYDAKAVPLLRHFALYKLDPEVFEEYNLKKSGINLAEGKSARVNSSKREVEVEFGGIYPFNTVKFDGAGVWNYIIEAFDGSNYQAICSGMKPGRNHIVRLPETIRGSYKMRIVSPETDALEDWNIGVYEL